jgi:hypothetical protein
MTDYALAVARAVDPAILAAIPRQPSPPAVTDRHGQNASPKVTAAVAEYRASSKARGELIRIATKHGVHVTAIISRIKREDARTHPTP